MQITKKYSSRKLVIFSIATIMCLTILAFLPIGSAIDNCPTCMVSYWKLDEDSGNVIDYYNSNHGTNYGAIRGVTGQVDYAYSFDGVDDYLEIPDDSTLNLGTGDFTFEAWINASTSQNSYPIIIGKRSGSSPGNSGFLFGLWSNGRLFIQIGGMNNNPGNTNLRDNSWHHVAVTRSGTAITYYVDGVVDGTETAGNDASAIGHNLYIGMDEFATITTPFNGVIDEVAVYNCSLTASTIECHYQAGLAYQGYCGYCHCTPICRNVEDNVEFCTIQEAIDASTTTNGETIEIYSGTHIEQVEVYKSLTIYGQGMGSTIIQSPDTLTKYFTSSNNNYPVVYVHDIDGVVIHNLTVDGAGKGNGNYRFNGIGIYEAGANVKDVEIKNVRDTPFSGVQHGVAIYGYSDQTGTPHDIILQSCNIHDYQKNAVALIGSDLTVAVTGCTVTGAGPTTVTAQNGIQVGNGATGSITENTVTGCSYTGPSWAASGILPYLSGGVLEIKGNILSENQVNVYLAGCSADVFNNTISASAAGTGQTYFYGIIGDPGDPPIIPDPDPLDPGILPSKRITYVMNCMGNILNGDGSSGGVGIGVYAGMYGTYDIDFTAMYNDVLNWGVGFELYEYAPNNLISAEIHYNNIVGNDYGIYNWLTTTYNADCNWWGDISGPSGNGPGTGDYVSPYITYCPWLDDEYPYGDCFGGAVCWNTRTGIAYCCIQCSIDDPLTLDGDTIQVFDGVHYEHVVIHKSLTMELDPVRAPTIIDGGGTGVGFTIKAPNVVIDGFEIRNCQIGIRTFGGPANYQDLTVRNCEIYSNTQNGMLFVHDTFDDVEINNCYIHNNGQNGIGMGNTATIDSLFIVDTQITTSGQHNMFFANVNINLISLVNVDLTNAQTYSGMFFGTTPSNIGVLYMEGGSISNNNEVGFGINQVPSTFGQIWLYDVEFMNNGGSGVILGGGATAQQLRVELCTFNGNGWEDFDLSGGWFGPFNSPDVYFLHNEFYQPTVWCSLYVGNAGNLPNVVLFENNFHTPNGWGVYSENPSTIMAICNYWGHNTGPIHPTTGPCAQGRYVSSNVIVVPYLHAPWPGGICIDPLIPDPDGPYFGNEGQTIPFIGSATGGQPPYTYYWTFGDGYDSNLQNPTHNYWTAGFYTVTLTVTDNLGITCTVSTSATIVPVGTYCEPEVWVDDDYHLGTPGWQVTHFALLQYALDAVCPGGTVHIYQGLYTNDVEFLVYKDGITIIGYDAPVIATPMRITSDFVQVYNLVFNPSSGTAALTVEGDYAIINHNIFLKNCIDDATGIHNTGMGTDARYNYWGAPNGPSGGMIDPSTSRAAKGYGTLITGDPFMFDPWAGVHAEITASQTDIEPGQSILFSSSNSFAYLLDGTANNYDVLWDFDDGYFSQDRTITHVFDQPGSYQVSLRVRAADTTLHPGFMYDWDFMIITVTHPTAPLDANAGGGSLREYQTETDTPIQITGSASGGTLPYTYSWKLGDGRTTTGNNPTVSYSEEGTYTLTLTVKDQTGDTATDTAQVTVLSPGELSISIVAPTTTQKGYLISLSSSIYGGRAPYTYSWSFGDGQTSIEANPYHIYNSDGTYTVTLTVTDNENNKKTTSHDIKVGTNDEESKVDIINVKGGLSISAVIIADNEPVTWRIKVEGRIFLGGEAFGVIPSKTSLKVKLPFTVGFGQADITITANDITKQYTAFMIGPIFLKMTEA